MPLRCKKQKGFSLLEVLIGLFIMGLILTIATSGLSTYASNKQYQKTNVELEHIRQALLSYVVINGFLPCPDTSGDGLENRTSGRCTNTYGRLPYLQLDGVGRLDGFGQPFFYKVNGGASSLSRITQSCEAASLFAEPGTAHAAHYLCQTPYRQYCGTNAQTNCDSFCAPSSCIDVQPTRARPPYFNLLTPPIGTQTGSNGLVVCSENATSCTSLTQSAANYIIRHVPVIVGSYGRNGAQTWANCNNANPREQTNCDGNRYFQLDPYSDSFDDMLTWISMHEIKFMMQNQIDWHLP
ncbi:type II secretion system protein [Thiomicrospira microaerophila]|uniref:type II secretion system protein n=1 Tax=Thiomicrospira microaerophila TaxID=406020 RepID=UPI000697EA69|nr:type II secretion system protein [Thiomicrospira microaerophila]